MAHTSPARSAPSAQRHRRVRRRLDRPVDGAQVPRGGRQRCDIGRDHLHQLRHRSRGRHHQRQLRQHGVFPIRVQSHQQAGQAGIIFVAAAGTTDSPPTPATITRPVTSWTTSSPSPPRRAPTRSPASQITARAPSTSPRRATKSCPRSIPPTPPPARSAAPRWPRPTSAGRSHCSKPIFPSDSYRQLINRLLRSVTKLPGLTGKVQSGGRLNLAQALSSTDNRPMNDDFATRAQLSGPNVRVRASNAGATREAGEPCTPA